MIVILNKIDLIDENTRKNKLDKMTRGLEKVFAKTPFKNCPVVPYSTKVLFTNFFFFD